MKKKTKDLEAFLTQWRSTRNPKRLLEKQRLVSSKSLAESEEAIKKQLEEREYLIKKGLVKARPYIQQTSTIQDIAMNEKKMMRGVSNKLAEAFKESCLYRLYTEHKDELIIGVRNEYINLYYNCDSIAKVKLAANGKLKCEIAPYYLNEKGDKYKSVLEEKIVEEYHTIKKNSNGRSTSEKEAQAQLVLLNNGNPQSNWFCIDVEYKKQFSSKAERDFNGRFDIIAVSKAIPHQIAIIELKYGSGAISGNSGIYKHVEDFKSFRDKGYFENLKAEIAGMLESQIQLGISVPHELHNTNQYSFNKDPEFYFITLDNNAQSAKAYTPKQTMAGYLFKEERWDCKRLSKEHCIEQKFGDITRKDNDFQATFLFSRATLPELGITDIIDGKYDEIIRPE